MSKDSLSALSEDIFRYFGLGCRNVAKLFIEEGFNLNLLFEAFENQKERIHHHKYKNNFDFNLALYLMNKIPIKSNDFILLKEDASIASRVACVHYEYFKNLNSLLNELENVSDQVQCIVTSNLEAVKNGISFGQSQSPRLADYADGVDTMSFLTNLN